MPDTRWLYVGLIGLVVLERLVELVITERNARSLKARGGFEVGRDTLSAHGIAPHRPADRRAARGVPTRTSVPAALRHRHAGAARRHHGPALLGDHEPRRPLDHPRLRGARRAAGGQGPLPLAAPPQLPGGDRRGRGPAADPRRLVDGDRFFDRQRPGAPGPYPGRGRGTRRSTGTSVRRATTPTSARRTRTSGPRPRRPTRCSAAASTPARTPIWSSSTSPRSTRPGTSTPTTTRPIARRSRRSTGASAS